MIVADDVSRRSAAVGASLALHAVALVMLARDGSTRLTLDGAPLVLTFVEAASRSAAPGEIAPHFQQAPAVSNAGLPETPELPEVPAAEAAPLAPAAPVPAPAARPKPSQRKTATPEPSREKTQPAPPAAPAGTASDAATPANGDAVAATTAGTRAQSGSASGADARSTAPAWAATARIRYEELLFAWMNRHKEYPMLAQRRGIEGRGSVRVRIDRGGRVLERALTSSTGQSVLDQAALDMVRRASPFPAVPSDYAGSSFEFVAPIEYRLR